MAQTTGIYDAPSAQPSLRDDTSQRITSTQLPTPPRSSSSSSSKDRSRSLEHHFSIESKQFSGAALKKLATPSPDSVIIPLGAGRPSPALFPWDCTTLQDSKSEGEAQRVVLKDAPGYDLSAVLDYGHAEGSPQMLRFVREHMSTIHNPPYSDWATCMSSGSTSALEIALRIFCNRSDAVLTEQFTYPGFIEVASLMGLAMHGVDVDSAGIRPDSMRDILQNWDERVQGVQRPTVLYTIPSGHNPTGTTQPLQRKQEIYEIAEQFDLIIVEDDPYYFLQLETSTSTDETTAPFTKNLIPSYLSLDKSGRVVRLDSASKILAPGLRIGWVTANESIVDKFASYHEVCTAFPSGLSQLMLFNRLSEEWGQQGFLGWLSDLSSRYRKRRDILLKACQENLPGDICTWNVPTRGMFVWVRVDLASHPNHVAGAEFTSDECSAIDGSIMTRAFEKGVQVTNGSLFQAASASSSPQSSQQAVFFRLAYAAAADAELVTGVQLFAEAVRDEFSQGAAQGHSETPTTS